MRTLARDDYQRPYIVDLARLFPAAGPTSLQFGGGAAMSRADRVISDAGTAMISVEGPSFPERADESFAPSFRPDAAQRPRRRFALTLRAGPLTASFWRSFGAGSLPDMIADDFLGLIPADRGGRLEVALGRVRISFDHGVGRRSAAPFGPSAEYPSTATRIQIAGNNGSLDWRMRIGTLGETAGPLGSFLQPGGAFAMPSRTDYSSAGFTWRIATGLWIDADAGLGRSRVPSGLLHLAAGALSSHWRLSVTTDCARFGVSCDFLRAELTQPIRIETGRFETLLEAIPDEYFATPNYSIRSFSAVPSGRQIDLRLIAGRRFGDGSSLLLEGYGARHPGHSRFAPPAHGLLARWVRSF